MNFDSIELERGSDITYTIRRWARETRPFFSIVHLAFTGTYRDGSAGAPDAHFIRGITSIVNGAWRPSAVILDFSEMTYEWGDEMAMLLPPVDDDTAVVVSDKCRQAISTIHFGIDSSRDITELSNYFTRFDHARRYVAQRLVDHWNENVNVYLDASEMITLSDLGIGG